MCYFISLRSCGNSIDEISKTLKLNKLSVESGNRLSSEQCIEHDLVILDFLFHILCGASEKSSVEIELLCSDPLSSSLNSMSLS